MQFSDLQVNYILEKVGASLWLNKINKGSGEGVLTTLKSFLVKGGVDKMKKESKPKTNN